METLTPGIALHRVGIINADFLSLILSLLLATTLPAQEIFYNNAAEWKAIHGTIEQKDYLGRKALYLSRGLAVLASTALTDGVIEVDIAGAVMAGIAFRIDSALNYEEAYVRLPKSDHTDALQYGPVFNGEFSWQFYSEYQSKVSYPPNQWVHLKAIVAGDQAVVYVLKDNKPAMLIDSLRIHDAGHVGIWSLSAGAYFSNFTFRPLGPTDRFDRIPKRDRNNPFAIKKWQVSDPAKFVGVPGPRLPEAVGGLQWRNAFTEPDGYLNINRFAKKQISGMGLQNSTDQVWLKYEWNEPARAIKPLSFEYGNQAFIYLNGQKVFSGVNTFLLKGEFYRGDMDKKLLANTIFLPVKKGSNSLLISIVSKGNGWGFLAQFADGNAVFNH